MSTRAFRHHRRRGRFAREARGQSLVRADVQAHHLQRSYDAAQKRLAAKAAEVPVDPRKQAYQIARAEELSAIAALVIKVRHREEQRARLDHEAALRDDVAPMLSSEWSPTSGRTG